MKKLLSHKSVLIISIIAICCNLIMLSFFTYSDQMISSKVKLYSYQDVENTRQNYTNCRKAYRKMGYQIDKIDSRIEKYDYGYWSHIGSSSLMRKFIFPNGCEVNVYYLPDGGNELLFYYVDDDEDVKTTSIENLSDCLIEIMSYENNNN